MAGKKRKAIRRLKKQLKKRNARIKKMQMEIRDLQAAASTKVGNQMAEELQPVLDQEDWPDSKFSATEVETANELTDDAEEVADILEKKDKL